MTSKPIAIYDDGLRSQSTLFRRIASVNLKSHLVDAHDILDGALNTHCALIIPGGADLYYCEKLNGKGNHIIRQFVHNGGGYLGICAGAYYAAKHCAWAKDTPDMAIVANRELALLDVVASGPINTFLPDADPHGSWRHAAELQAFDATLLTMYNGGCRFTYNTHAVETVLATYTETSEPAIIEGRHGNGRVILSSPHFEMTANDFERQLYRHRNPHYAHDMHVLEKLRLYQDAQEKLFETLLYRLITPL